MHRLFRSVPRTFSTASAAVICALCAVGASATVQAATLTENFDAPFPAWESGWFGTESNAINACSVTYCLVDGVPVDPSSSVRGNAGSGMWLMQEGGYTSSPINITFDPAFGASLTSLSLDTVSYLGNALTSPSTLSAYDTSGRAIFSHVLRPHYYGDVPPSSYLHFTITSTDGIAGFSYSGPAAGNVIIDNVVAVTSAVPEPASAALLLGGLALLGGARLGHRRR